MFIEQIERLRCTSSHEETWLIATFIDVADRFIKKGKLGCYLCHREFLIENGVAIFVNTESGESNVAGHKAQGSEGVDGAISGLVDTARAGLVDPTMAELVDRTRVGSVNSTTAEPVDADFQKVVSDVGAMGVAAFLNISERSTAVLFGSWSEFSNQLTEILPTKVFAVNPILPDGRSFDVKASFNDQMVNDQMVNDLTVKESEDVSILFSSISERIPLALGSVGGVALDRANASQAMVDDAVRILIPGGRMIAPVSIPIPPQVSQLAKDDNFWIGEKHRELITLSR